MASPHLVRTERQRVTLDANTPTLVTLAVPTQGRVTTLLAKQRGNTSAAITLNLYDREDGTDLVADDSVNPDDNVDPFASECHRVVATISGTGGVAQGYGLEGYYVNCDEKPAESAWELGQLHLVISTTVAGVYDVAITVVGVY